MRLYLAKIERYVSKWFTSRREAEKWANREFAEYKEWHDKEVREEHDYHVPRNSHLLATKEVITITPLDVPTDKQGLLHFLNVNCTE